MQLLFFIVFYPLIWVVSKLSFRLLYIVSDLVFYFIYYVLRYRRKTIYNNLKMVFPDKTKKEIKEISKNSVRNSTDTFVESFKSLSISEDEMKSRFRFKNIEVIHEIENKNQSVIVLCGHFSGFEWVFIVDRYIKSNFYAVYKRLRNKYFDRLVKKIRSRWNGHLIHTKRKNTSNIKQYQ